MKIEVRDLNFAGKLRNRMKYIRCECGSDEVSFTGNTSIDPKDFTQFEHECQECGKKAWFLGIFPYKTMDWMYND